MARRRMLTTCIAPAVVVTAAGATLVVAKRRGWLYDESRIAKRLKVVSVSMRVDLDPRVNRLRMVDIVEAARQAHPDVELVLFGEAILGWYSRKGKTAVYHRSIAESIPGETTATISRLAKEYSIYISFGMSELREDLVYNSQVLIDPQGEIVAVHRKVNLQGSKSFQPGTVPVTLAQIKGVKTAIIICSDIQDRKVRSELAAQQPELILGSLANPSDRNWFVNGMIAKMFDAWIVTANRYGAEDGFFFDGQMVVADPLGDLRLTAKDQAQFIFYDIGFSVDRSPAIKVFRRAYVGLSLAVHFIKGLGMLSSDN